MTIALSQDTAIYQSDTDSIYIDKKLELSKRSRLVWAGHGLAYSSSFTGLYFSWYKGHPFGKFSFVNDNRKWLQVDKAGHAYSGYIQGRISIEAWQWAGLPHNKAVWKGGLTGFAFQNIVEILDGFSGNWGFSWGDYIADMAGTGLVMGQEFAWKEQRILFKFSTHKRSYPDKDLHIRAREIYGESLAGQLLNDYNAQTYWLSINPRSFIKKSSLPRWLNIAVGYGADQLFGEFNNNWKAEDGSEHDRRDLKRKRQFYISPDVDLSQFQTSNRLIRTILFVLNSLKFPAPSFEYSNGKTKFHWISF